VQVTATALLEKLLDLVSMPSGRYVYCVMDKYTYHLRVRNYYAEARISTPFRTWLELLYATRAIFYGCYRTRSVMF